MKILVLSAFLLSSCSMLDQFKTKKESQTDIFKVDSIKSQSILTLRNNRVLISLVGLNSLAERKTAYHLIKKEMDKSGLTPIFFEEEKLAIGNYSEVVSLAKSKNIEKIGLLSISINPIVESDRSQTIYKEDVFGNVSSETVHAKKNFNVIANLLLKDIKTKNVLYKGEKVVSAREDDNTTELLWLSYISLFKDVKKSI